MSKKKEELSKEELPQEQPPEETTNEAPNEGNQKAPEEQKEPTELEKAQALAEDYKRKWYAVSAEYDNYRKRNAAAVSKAYADGASETLLKILPVADNFGYAYASADEKTRQGIDKIIKNFNAIIQSFGAQEIEINVGDEFNEAIAEAVLSFPCEEGEKPHTVKQILKKGYKLGDKVIRFAQVAVTV